MPLQSGSLLTSTIYGLDLGEIFIFFKISIYSSMLRDITVLFIRL